VDVNVKSADQLDEVLQILRSSKNIASVERVKG